MTENSEPLFSQEAEQALVGAALINPGILTVLDIQPGEFYIHRLRWVWEAFERLSKSSSGIDLVTVVEELDRMGKSAEVPLGYLAGLITSTPSSLGAEDYAGIVRNYARRRSWRDLANQVARYAFDMDTDLEQKAPAIIDGLLQAVQSKGSAEHISKYTRSVLDQAIERMENPQDLFGIPTGFKDFDEITGGLQPGEVLYLSGVPGVGKSILAMQMAFQMAASGHPGVIYSMEMSGSQVVRRRLSEISKIKLRLIQSGKFDPTFLTKLVEAAQKMDQLPLYLSEDTQWTTSSLRADLARLKNQHHVESFVIDYAYLLKDGQGLSENDRTGLISAQLKSIARSMNLSGIVIHSLRKEGMSGAPGGQDLRGSGQQFYDPDLLLFLTENKDEKNVVICSFGKGRELENPKQSFRLVKIPGFPALGDYMPAARAGGMERKSWAYEQSMLD